MLDSTEKFVSYIINMEKNTKLFIMIGISGSGKSTHAKKIAVENTAQIVETDAIRKELSGNEEDQTKNGEVFSLAKRRVQSIISAGNNVVFDATNVKKRDRKDFIDIGKDVVGCEIIACYIRPNLEVAKKQNSMRTRKVPEFVLEKHFNSIEPPTVLEGFSEIIFL